MTGACAAYTAGAGTTMEAGAAYTFGSGVYSMPDGCMCGVHCWCWRSVLHDGRMSGVHCCCWCDVLPGGSRCDMHCWFWCKMLRKRRMCCVHCWWLIRSAPRQVPVRRAQPLLVPMYSTMEEGAVFPADAGVMKSTSGAVVATTVVAPPQARVRCLTLALSRTPSRRCLRTSNPERLSPSCDSAESTLCASMRSEMRSGGEVLSSSPRSS